MRQITVTPHWACIYKELKLLRDIDVFHHGTKDGVVVLSKRIDPTRDRAVFLVLVTLIDKRNALLSRKNGIVVLVILGDVRTVNPGAHEKRVDVEKIYQVKVKSDASCMSANTNKLFKGTCLCGTPRIGIHGVRDHQTSSSHTHAWPRNDVAQLR